MFDMNLDLSMGGIHLEAKGRIAGHVAPRKKPRNTLRTTIHQYPAAAAAGDSSVQILARSVL